MRFLDAVMAALRGVEDDGSFDIPGGPADYQRLRSEALGVTAEDLDLPQDWLGKPYGVILEKGAKQGTLTLVAFATGAANLFLSRGGGVIGKPSHVHVVVQAKRLVKLAAQHVGEFEAASTLPPPPFGQARFYLLTASGVVTAAESTQALASGQSPLSPLFNVAEELLSEFVQLTL